MSAPKKSTPREKSAATKKAPASEIKSSAPTPHFGIVVSDYNHEYTEGLLEGAHDCLATYEVTVIHVPGAFEIPLQIQRLAESGSVDAILALGVIWEGKTRHAEDISRAVTDALMRIMLDTDIPIFHEVLTIKNEADARERCLKKKQNRGREAAEAALAVVLPGRHAIAPREHASGS